MMVAAVPLALMLTAPFLRLRWEGKPTMVLVLGSSSLAVLWAVANLVLNFHVRLACHGGGADCVRTLTSDSRFSCLKGKRIATQGSAQLAVSLLRWQAFNRNSYCGWNYWVDCCSEKRREAILSGFEAAVADESNEWLASELTKEAILLKYGQNRPTMKRVLGEYEFFHRDMSGVNLYRRKAR